MFNKLFFSIIIPTFNRKNFLNIAINSVLQQTFKDFELIIIDDGSSDGTAKFTQKINDSRISYVWQHHKGVSSARNKGITESHGEIITFLDSDDRFRMHKLETMYKFIKRFPHYKIYHTEEIWYKNGALLSHKSHHTKPEGFVFTEALRQCCISMSTVGIRKDIFKKVGLFDENLVACEDYDFWLRVTSQYPVKLIPEILTIKEGGHLGQQSKKYPAMDRFRIYAIDKLLKSGHLKPKQRKLAIEELKRKCTILINGAVKRNKTQDVKYYNSLINTYS